MTMNENNDATAIGLFVMMVVIVTITLVCLIFVCVRCCCSKQTPDDEYVELRQRMLVSQYDNAVLLDLSMPPRKEDVATEDDAIEDDAIEEAIDDEASEIIPSTSITIKDHVDCFRTTFSLWNLFSLWGSVVAPNEADVVSESSSDDDSIDSDGIGGDSTHSDDSIDSDGIGGDSTHSDDSIDSDGIGGDSTRSDDRGFGSATDDDIADHPVIVPLESDPSQGESSVLRKLLNLLLALSYNSMAAQPPHSCEE